MRDYKIMNRSSSFWMHITFLTATSICVHNDDFIPNLFHFSLPCMIGGCLSTPYTKDEKTNTSNRRITWEITKLWIVHPPSECISLSWLQHPFVFTMTTLYPIFFISVCHAWLVVAFGDLGYLFGGRCTDMYCFNWFLIIGFVAALKFSYKSFLWNCKNCISFKTCPMQNDRNFLEVQWNLPIRCTLFASTFMAFSYPIGRCIL